VDGAIAGVDYDGLAAAVHFAVDAGRGEGAVDGDGDAEADVTVVSAGVDGGLHVAGDGHVNAAVARFEIPGGNDAGTLVGADFDAAIAAAGVDDIEAAFEADAAIAGSGVDVAVEISGFDAAVAGAETDIALAAENGDAAVAGFGVDAAADVVGFDGAIACGGVEVGVLGHVNFYAEIGVVHAEAEEGAGGFGFDVDGVAVLRGADVKVVIEFVAGVDDADFNLVDVAGGDADGAVVGGDAKVGVAGDRESFGDFFGAGGGGEKGKRGGQDCGWDAGEDFHVIRATSDRV